MRALYSRPSKRVQAMSGLVIALVALAGVGVSSASAAAPVWSIRSFAWPTNFQPEHDVYTLVVENVGAAASSSEPITVKDTLPEGITVSSNLALIPGWTCGQEEPAGRWVVTCTSAGAVVPSLADAPFSAAQFSEFGESSGITIEVNASGAPRSVLNEATVSGGGAPAAASTGEPSTVPNTVDEPASSFGVDEFGLSALNALGGPDEQAGDHPNAVTASFGLELPVSYSEANQEFRAAEEVKEVVVDLPVGLVGDPLAAERCSLAEMAKSILLEFGCLTASRVGTFDLFRAHNGVVREGSPIFNMVPEAGYPAEFGLYYWVLQRWIVMYASVVHTPLGYVLRTRIPGILRAAEAAGAAVTFFGDPAEHDGGATPLAAFLTNPTACSTEPLNARIEANSWEHPDVYVSKEATVYPQITGCNLLQFNPTIAVSPEETQTDTPSGYEVDLKVPQSANLFPVAATPELKNATVTLPEGVSVSPSAANGLAGCNESGPEGIDIPHGEGRANEIGEGEEAGVNGIPRLAKGHCPAASQIGTVEVETPLLPAHTLTGHVYLAQPKCGGEGQPSCTEASATNGELYGIYLEIEDNSEGHSDGVIVKLKGKVEADPHTGQLTARFEENPQIPFSELRLKLNGGERAPLANPQSCGTFTATSDLEPWSTPVTPDATPSSPFAITRCAGSPFAPSFSAGTVTPSAGTFSPFTLTFSRHDGEQDLSGLTVSTPPGLLGVLKSVVQCPEPQAQKGECGEGSLIGHDKVAAGAGSQPFWEAGRVYLTGPYNGAPFGLSIVTPAKAGPFNLGNVIVRTAIQVNPNTGALTVTSNPLPQIIDGVPLRIQTVNVTIDRPGFMFNPTNCDQQQIAGTITSAEGANVGVSSPFAVENCANLPFKPSFAASTQGKTSKANGASLIVRVAQRSGEANIHKVDLQLPVALPSRLTTLQKACTEAQFNANPAGCPEGSFIGTAKAVTPVLNVPMTGPAILVSHGGAAFPDVEFILQGEGVEIVLDGKTQIKKGITYSHFETVPDAPISTFETVLPQGPHSVLGTNIPASAKYSLCGRSLTMPTTIKGQNGAVVKQTTKITVTGCAKALTRAQKLAAALKTCRTKAKGKRAGCEKRARKQYALAKAGATKKHNKQH